MDEESGGSVDAGLFPFVKLSHLALHGGVAGVHCVKDITDEQGNEAETDVLHPEDEAICAAEHFLLDDLRH